MFTSEPNQSLIAGRSMAHEWRMRGHITRRELRFQERTLEPTNLQCYSRTIFHMERSPDDGRGKVPTFRSGERPRDGQH